jgi:hypothetical protein
LDAVVGIIGPRDKSFFAAASSIASQDATFAVLLVGPELRLCSPIILDHPT